MILKVKYCIFFRHLIKYLFEAKKEIMKKLHIYISQKNQRNSIKSNRVRWGSAVLISTAVLLFSGCAVMTKNKTIRPTGGKALDHFIEAKVFENKGDYFAAILEYQDALLYDPKADEILRALATAYLQIGKLNRAIATAEISIKYNPKSIETKRLVYDLYKRRGDLKNAYRILKDIIKIAPFNIIDQINLIKLCNTHGEPKKSEKIAIKLSERNDLSLHDLYHISSVMNIQGSMEGSIKPLLKIIEMDPSQIEAYIRIGDIYEKFDGKKTQEDVLMMGLKNNPDDARLIIALGNMYMINNDWSKAIRDFQKARKTINVPELIKTLTYLYYYNRNDSLASAYLDSVTLYGYDDAKFYFSLGKTFVNIDNFQEAVQSYEKGFAKDSKSISPYFNYCYALLQLGLNDKVILVLNSLLQKNPSYKELHFWLGEAYFRKELWENALDSYYQLMEVNPDDIRILFRLAVSYERLGKYEKSYSFFKEIISKDPKNSLAMNYLGYMFAENNINLKDAKKLIKKALKLEPENGAFLDSMGWVYYRLGKFRKAEQYIVKALQHASEEDKPVILDHYGDILNEFGRHQEAINVWKKSLEFDPNNENLRNKLQNLER